MIELLKAALFGLVEGVTEWLPVSSTGHMILLNEFVTLRVSAIFWQMFLVIIQLGAILAVVVLYWNTIWPFKKDRETGKIRVNRKRSVCGARPLWHASPRLSWVSWRTTGWRSIFTTGLSYRSC